MNIPFTKPSLGQSEIWAVARVMQSGWLAAGPEVEAFEKEFSDYISPEGKRYYCIFTNSCTSALKMAYKWASENGFGHVAYHKNTFCATYSAAREMGFDTTPYLPFESGTIDGSVREDRVNMHYGSVKDETPCLIEDSAHRIEPNDPLVGKIRCYSFHATKNMTTGYGGMFVTNDKDIYERARLYWQDGLTTTTRERAGGADDYEVKAFAVGYDGNDIAAAIGRVQLRKLPGFTRRRNEIRDRYNSAFGSIWAGNHLYPYFVDKLESVTSLRQFLRDVGIGTSYHYPGTGWLGVSLPLFPDMTDEQVDYVIEKVKQWSPTT